jgi:hypothetical protein
VIKKHYRLKRRPVTSERHGNYKEFFVDELGRSKAISFWTGEKREGHDVSCPYSSGLNPVILPSCRR